MLAKARLRVLRSVVAAGVVAGLVVTAQPAFAHGGGGADLYVEPGESIQAAADLAESGDTIRLAAGEFYEAVCIVGKGLTIVGAGRNKTTILPPATAPSANECWSLTPPPTAPGQPPEDGYSALHFEDPDRPVTVTRLSTEGHPGSGIVAHGATGSPSRAPAARAMGSTASWQPKARRSIKIVNNVETDLEVPSTRPGRRPERHRRDLRRRHRRRFTPSSPTTRAPDGTSASSRVRRAAAASSATPPVETASVF